MVPARPRVRQRDSFTGGRGPHPQQARRVCRLAGAERHSRCRQTRDRWSSSKPGAVQVGARGSVRLRPNSGFGGQGAASDEEKPRASGCRKAAVSRVVACSLGSVVGERAPKRSACGRPLIRFLTEASSGARPGPARRFRPRSDRLAGLASRRPSWPHGSAGQRQRLHWRVEWVGAQTDGASRRRPGAASSEGEHPPHLPISGSLSTTVTAQRSFRSTAGGASSGPEGWKRPLMVGTTQALPQDINR